MIAREKLEEQIDALLDGALGADAFKALEAELQNSAEAREVYYQRVALHSLLHEDAEEHAGAAVVAFPRPPTAPRWKTLAAAAAIVLGIGASVMSGWFAARKSAPVATGNPTEPSAKPALTATGFGVIGAAADARWADGSAPSQGALVKTGALKLQSGLVKLELFSGVTVILEGEAEFELLSAMAMRVDRGKVRALVPPGAEGFRVSTAAGELVDMGTEFAIDVTPEHADLRVLDGEVEWHPSSGGGSDGKQLLEKGAAVRWTADGQAAEPVPAGTGAQRIAAIEESLNKRRDLRRQAWLDQIDGLKGDVRLLAHFPMLQPGASVADNSPARSDATVVRAETAADRWGHPASALDFSRTGSRVRVDVPGTHRSLTLLCWARIDGLDRQFNSLFLTHGHEIGEPHWQITRDGRLFFSVKKREWQGTGGGDKHIFRSPPIWQPSDSGRWMQIATVYDCDALAVTHYVDGRPVSTERIPSEYLVEEVNIGAASLANWSDPKHSKDPNFVIRNLNGRIDEFALFGAALDAGEIARLYEIGRP